jgi:cytochrome c55X
MSQCYLHVLATIGLTLGMTFFPTQSTAQVLVAVDAARSVELVHLVRQDCGSCHGLTLNGGLGPALVPDALKGKPADYLKAIILHGRAGTAMPPWMRFLSDADAEWIVINLKKGFPDGH